MWKLLIDFRLGIVAVALVAFSFTSGVSDLNRGWGTASFKIIPFTQTSINTKSILRNAWLANLPQFLLSMIYFMINRTCTSIYSAIE